MEPQHGVPQQMQVPLVAATAMPMQPHTEMPAAHRVRSSHCTRARVNSML